MSALTTSTVFEQVSAAVAEAGYDCVIATSSGSVRYLSGYWAPWARFHPNRPFIVVWPAAGDPIMLVGADQTAGPARGSWIRDIRTYAERRRRPPGEIVDELAKIIYELGLARGRIGLEFLSTSLQFYNEFRQTLSEVDFVQCDEFLEQLRAVKTSEEIDMITLGAHATEQGLMAAITQARLGWTEKQLADAINLNILRCGASDVLYVLLGAGEGAKGFLPPTDAVMPQGSLVRIDILAIRDGYYADIGRMAVVGSPSAEQENIYKCQLELNQSIVDFMRPGVPAASVFDHCQEVAQELGVELLDQPSIGIGHMIGVNPQDLPVLKQSDQSLLAAGMVLNIEPDIFGPQREIVHVEEMVLVGTDGARTITATEDWSALPRIGN